MANDPVRAFSLALTVSAMTIVSSHAAPLAAQQQTAVSLRDSFPIGSNGLCEAQITAPQPGAGLFDRRYAVICRDASAPVGTLWVTRTPVRGDVAGRFVDADAVCEERPFAETTNGHPAIKSLTCTSTASIIRTSVLVSEAHGRTFAASGFAAYQDALELGVASLASDTVVAGVVEIPLTQASDAAAFARTQAQAISSNQAMSEAYRRSNSGRFAEAAEFFAVTGKALSGAGGVEARLNEGLQQSNLGNFSEAARLFNGARTEAGRDPVLARMLRNYEALDALNRQNASEALRIASRPIDGSAEGDEALRQLVIGNDLALRLAAENSTNLGGFSATLSTLERVQLFDGQSSYLTAAALRLAGRDSEAVGALQKADSHLSGVRSGRVTSIIWLRAQILGELAELSERTGQGANAEQLHREGIALLDLHYPGSPVLQSAQAQLAGYYARQGRSDEALKIYRAIVEGADGRPAPTLRNLLAPYFDLLLQNGAGPNNASDLFAASQLLQRPGLAQTQAVLARELSGGSDEASQLFRKATNIGRAIESQRALILSAGSGDTLAPEAAKMLAERTQQLEKLQSEQAAIQQQLAEYPRFRALSEGAVELGELQQVLKEGEAYVKIVNLERDTFVVFASRDETIAYRATLTPADLEREVDALRASIAVTEGNEVLTYPFDIERSRALFTGLFAPISDRLISQSHIVFEPDGALLRLPMNLLVTDDASVTRYSANLAKGGDEYDFRGTAWLGRAADISTSVSPAAFRDVRAAKQASGARAYLGLGQNIPINPQSAPLDSAGGTRSVFGGGDECQWSPTIWNNPISAAELFAAAARFGGVGSGTSEVVAQAGFSDTAIMQRTDLRDFRVVHFATHGLVTAPQPECPPRPALLTSFGGEGSDGLLSFAEIFSLQLDADLIVLSACDTAGGATVAASREAGLASGGAFALDGLVRAFVGAGGRTVVASHWPVPDDYDATQRLITGLLSTEGRSTAGSLRQSQIALMDQADTSHPFYWSAFAVVGDGAQTITR